MRFVVTTAILLAILADAAKGQARRDRHVVGGGRIATIAPAPTPVVVVAPTQFFGGFPSAFSPIGFFPAAAFVQNFPVVILQDGRVFANFGFGFEQVVRACGVNGIGVTTNAIVGVPASVSTIAQPIPVQPQVIQPAPVQQTASEQQLIRALYPASVVTLVPGPFAAQIVTPSCWSTFSGSVFVFRR
jgi:hypothetical protein